MEVANGGQGMQLRYVIDLREETRSRLSEGALCCVKRRASTYVDLQYFCERGSALLGKI